MTDKELINEYTKALAEMIKENKMNNDEKAQHNRITNRDKSDAAKLAWKRNRNSMMGGARRRERDNMKSFYSIAKELEETMSEAKILRDNEFEKQFDMSMDTISGGISLSIHDDKISFSTSLEETGSGAYKLTQKEDMDTLYKELKEEFQAICQQFDDEMKQLIAKHGLKSTL